jgi:hypothetical protein
VRILVYTQRKWGKRAFVLLAARPKRLAVAGTAMARLNAQPLADVPSAAKRANRGRGQCMPNRGRLCYGPRIGGPHLAQGPTNSYWPETTRYIAAFLALPRNVTPGELAAG